MLSITAHVGQSCHRAEVAVVAGALRAIAIPSVGSHSLGDVLARQGHLDAAAHRAALSHAKPAGEPVGEWLVNHGAARVEDVEQALVTQLHDRLLHVFGWSKATTRFTAGCTEVGVPHVTNPLSVSTVVMGAMTHALAGLSAAELQRRLGQGVLRTTRLGEVLLCELGADASSGLLSAPLIGLLQSGATVDALWSAAGGSTTVLRALLGLKLIGCVSTPGPDSYGLLLRKHRELGRQATARALLDLPRTARPEQGRRALRQLARRLHPDRFGAGAPESMRRMSNEILSALVRAEAELRAQG